MTRTQRVGLAMMLAAIGCMLILILSSVVKSLGQPLSTNTAVLISALWVFGVMAFILDGVKAGQP